MSEIQVKKYEVWVARDSNELLDSDPSLAVTLGESEFINSCTCVISVKEIEYDREDFPFREKIFEQDVDGASTQKDEWYDEWYEAAYKILNNTGEIVS